MTRLGTLAGQRSPQPGRLQTARRGEQSPSAILFLIALWFSLFFGLVFLVVLLVTTFLDGLGRYDQELITNYTSQIEPEMTGLRAAILGTIWVMGTTAVLAVPLGVAAAIYLEEFADTARWYNRLIEVNIQNLAAVPAIVYGMLTLGILGVLGPALNLQSDNVVIGGGIALALLILPVIIIASRESLRAVPDEIRSGSLALGATPWQTVWRQTLPSAVPGIATGTIIALSRAIGEAAPLLLLGGFVFVSYDPNGLLSGFTTLPIQIYSWIRQAQPEFQTAAAAGIIVLLVMLLALNGLAIVIRNKFQHRW